jgi:uncharacterized protein YggE
MTTDITVRGQSRDIRDPDRAVLHINVHAEARDWGEAHVAAASAIAALTKSIEELQAARPGALERWSVGQSYQSHWPVKGVQRFSESARVMLHFTDFSAMSEWAYANTSDIVQLSGIGWELSPALKDQVRRELGRAAIADARDRATTFADAANLTIIAVKALSDPGLLSGAINDGHPVAAAALLRGGAAPVISLTPEPIETVAEVEAHFLAE